jgi:hypothetical protein
MVWDLNPSRGKRFTHLQNRADWLLGPPGLLFNGYWGSFLGVKWLWCEVNHSLPSSAKVKNEWNYTFIPLYAFMAWTGTALLDRFYLKQSKSQPVDRGTQLIEVVLKSTVSCYIQKVPLGE